MRKISYTGYRFPPEVIDHAIWLYLRFSLSFRDVEDLLVERGIAVSYETVRRWVNHFGPMIAAQLPKRRPKPHATWHLDEVYLKIDGRMAYLWRTVDAEGEVLDVLVQSRRNKHAALTNAQAPEEVRLRPRKGWSHTTCDRMTQRLALSASRVCTSAGDGRTIGPKFASADPMAGAQDATFQERSLCAEIPLNPRRRLQHLLWH
jgi:hypothetical protein